jgi:ubiquinone/menaquinone biosynthesis C-methylase UbiE
VSYSDKNKEEHEFAWWQALKSEKGLANDHYQYFFTDHFGLSTDFYFGKRVLDIGCGPCGSLEWANMVSERVGLDPLANQYAKLGASNHKMRYVSGYSESIPFPDGYFDVVCSFNSIDHVSNLEKTIKEIVRVVAPNGLFLLLCDINHKPTACEPIELSWNVVDSFKPYFEVMDERHFERIKAGMYESINAGTPYNHSEEDQHKGVLSAKFRKRP